MHSTYGSTLETPIDTFPDWVGVPGSPCVSDEALPIMEDAPGSIWSFEREIDTISLNFNGLDQTYFPYQPGTTSDWHLELNDVLPFAHTLDSFPDDVSSSTYTLNDPLSPASEGTLVNSPASAALPELKLPPGEGPLFDPQLVSCPSLYPDAEFTFHCQPWSATPPVDAYTPMVQVDYAHQGYDQYWPEQLSARHELATACVIVVGHMTGIDTSSDSLTPTHVDPASPVSSPSVEFQQDTFAVGEEQKSAPVKRSKRHCNTSNGKLAGDKENTSQARKRPKQDTTKRFACNYLGCKSSMYLVSPLFCPSAILIHGTPAVFARTFNLNVHIRSVHLKQRIHACKAPGCERAFSRKHDLNRHFQSAHTNLGSPRKTAKEGGKAAKSWKSTKKAKRDE